MVSIANGLFLFTPGEPIDERGPVPTEFYSTIHAEAPDFVDMSVEQEILVTGIKVVDLLAPYSKGGKIGKYLVYAQLRYSTLYYLILYIFQVLKYIYIFLHYW